jgi:hypothetical protein
MAKLSKSTINDIGTLILMLVIAAIFIWAFRQQISTAVENALAQLAKGIENALVQFAIGIGILILALIPFGLGFWLIRKYVDNGTIATNGKWACFILSVAVLWVLSGWAIGYYVSTILSLFLFGVLAYLAYEAVKDLV